MDGPVPEPKYKLSMHSYYSDTTYANPLNWGDIGHAFVSLSKDDEVIAAVGLWPMQKDTRDSDVGVHYSTLIRWNKSQPGRVRSELETLKDHESDLRTESWDITPEQAGLALKQMDHDVRNIKTYDLYTNNCATYAKGFVEGMHLDTSSINSKDCYVKTMRPAAIWKKLSLEKRGTLKLPSEIGTGWKTEKGFTEDMALNEPEKYRLYLEQQERAKQYRLKMDEQIRLAKEKEKTEVSKEKEKTHDLDI